MTLAIREITTKLLVPVASSIGLHWQTLVKQFTLPIVVDKCHENPIAADVFTA